MKLYLCLPVVALLTAATINKNAAVIKPTVAFADTVAPGKILNLTNWKITIPLSTRPDGVADDIKQPELNRYSSQYFFTNPATHGVVFKAHVDGATTKGSNFPRSELREMANNGKDNASWSSSTGTHTLFIDQAVTHLPTVRDQVVIGQIHNADEYIIFFRLEHKRLLVSVNHGETATLDDNYTLGKRFTVKFVVNDDKTACYYNDQLKYVYNGTYNGAYFKAGAYVQSSTRGKKKTDGELPSAYGEVEIYNVWVKHE